MLGLPLHQDGDQEVAPAATVRRMACVPPSSPLIRSQSIAKAALKDGFLGSSVRYAGAKQAGLFKIRIVG